MSLVNEEGKLLENALIAVFEKNAKAYVLKNAKAYTNTQSGSVTSFADLDTGEYIVKELTAPTRHRVNSEAYPVEVRAGEDTELSILHVKESVIAPESTDSKEKDTQSTA